MTDEELEPPCGGRLSPQGGAGLAENYYHEESDMVDEILTLAEAAASLGICTKTVRRLLEEGRLQACGFADKRRVYFLASEVERAREQGMRKRGRPRKASDQTDRTDPSDRR